MGASIISKLKPNYLNKSCVEDNILIIKPLKCLPQNNALLNLKRLKKKFENIFREKSSDYKDIISTLKCKDKSSILIITFDNLNDLKYLPNCDIDSLDIVYVDKSFNKLKEIAKTYKDKLKLSLVECCAQDLPFIDNEFDVIINIGSFNKYQNRAKAIKEMQRVAKDSAKILIADSLDKSSIKLFKSLKDAQIDIKDNKYIVNLRA